MISIRKSKHAITGLVEMVEYIKNNSDIAVSDMTMAEIGSYVGDATKVFAEHFGKVICIDPFINGYDDKDSASFKYDMGVVFRQFQENILEKYNNVKLYIASSEKASKILEKNFFHFVYIDGNHKYEYVKKDIEIWRGKIEQGYWIGGHDYKNIKSVTKAVNECFNSNDIIVFKDTSWLVRCT